MAKSMPLLQGPAGADSKARAGVLAFVPSLKMAPWRAQWRAAAEKERYHGIHNDEEGNRLNALRKRCRALGARAAQSRGSGRRVLLPGAQHRRPLPPLVRRGARAPRA